MVPSMVSDWISVYMVLVTLAAIYLGTGFFLAKRTLSATLDQLQETETAMSDLVNGQVRAHMDLVTPLEEHNKNLMRELETERRRRDEVFSAVESAVAETRRWRDLYFVEAMEHGNAQVAMMAEISRLSHLLKQKGVTVKLNRGIEVAIREFHEHHPVTQEQYQEAKKNLGTEK